MSDSDGPELCQCGKEVETNPNPYATYCHECENKYTSCFICDKEIEWDDCVFKQQTPYCVNCYYGNNLNCHECDKLIENGMIIDYIAYCLDCYQKAEK